VRVVRPCIGPGTASRLTRLVRCRRPAGVTDPAPDWAPARFIADVRPGVFVGKDEVLAAIDRDEVRIASAFTLEQHSGERQDYARPGHIPGSSNVSFDELVDADTHRYLPERQLSAALRASSRPIRSR
jgi:3-mercaptopyruvate sulfurtransferase SseA